MSSNNIKLHKLQLDILKKLASSQSLNFNKLNIEGLLSEHMNYHLKKLVEFGLVEKQASKYLLSDRGKDYVNLMDDEVAMIEKQPKTSVLIHGVRYNEQTEQVEHLLCKRLKQPYLGMVGRLTGKVRYGESLEEAAARELMEETGLKAKMLVLERIYHKRRHRENGEFVQDVIFYVFFASDFSGRFITKTPYQENFFLSNDDLKAGAYKTFGDLNLDDRLKPVVLNFVTDIDVTTTY